VAAKMQNVAIVVYFDFYNESSEKNSTTVDFGPTVDRLVQLKK
jgi:hypothetical protein